MAGPLPAAKGVVNEKDGPLASVSVLLRDVMGAPRRREERVGVLVNLVIRNRVIIQPFPLRKQHLEDRNSM